MSSVHGIAIGERGIATWVGRRPRLSHQLCVECASILPDVFLTMSMVAPIVRACRQARLKTSSYLDAIDKAVHVVKGGLVLHNCHMWVGLAAVRVMGGWTGSSKHSPMKRLRQ